LPLADLCIGPLPSLGRTQRNRSYYRRLMHVSPCFQGHFQGACQINHNCY
jgi:hypothetical protein